MPGRDSTIRDLGSPPIEALTGFDRIGAHVTISGRRIGLGPVRHHRLGWKDAARQSRRPEYRAAFELLVTRAESSSEMKNVLPPGRPSVALIVLGRRFIEERHATRRDSFYGFYSRSLT